MTGRPCWRCGTHEGVRAYLNGPCCPAHTPAALAGHAEVVVDPTRTLAALRARRGIDAGAHQLPATTVVDERAVTSGKRRSSTHVHQAMKAAAAARRRTERRKGVTT